MIAAVQSTSWLSVVLGIVALLLACVGLVAVGHWLLGRLDDLVSRWHARHGQGDGGRWIVPEDTPPPRSVQPEPPAQPVTTPPAGSEANAAGGKAGPAGVSGAGGSERAAVAPPAHPGERCPSEAHEAMGNALAVSRGLGYAERLVAASLRELPGDRWLVEYSVLIPHYRIPFLIMGETGVFIVWAASAPPNWQHLLFATQVAVEVKKLLPGYGGEVRGAYCRALAREEVRPRMWVRSEPTGDDRQREYRAGPGAWVLDRHWLVRWLESFGPGQGVGVKDLERFRVLARQEPTRSRVPPPGATPFIDLVPNL